MVFFILMTFIKNPDHFVGKEFGSCHWFVGNGAKKGQNSFPRINQFS